MNIELINIWYVVAAALFIFGLKQLGSPATAVRGNMLSSLGMLIAVVVTLFNAQIISFLFPGRTIRLPKRWANIFRTMASRMST